MGSGKPPDQDARIDAAEGEILDRRNVDLPLFHGRGVADHGAPLVGLLQVERRATNPSRII